MANETQVCVRGWSADRPTTFDEVVDEKTAEVTRPNATIVRVGVTASYFSRAEGKYVDGVTNWYSVRTYGRLASNVASCVGKGVPLLVRGRLVPRTYQSKDGTEMVEQTIIADSVAIDLNNGTANYVKAATYALEPVEGERTYGNGDDKDGDGGDGWSSDAGLTAVEGADDGAEVDAETPDTEDAAGVLAKV